MVVIARIELGQHYHSHDNPGDFTIESIPQSSADYEPVETAWKTALAIARSRRFRRALSNLAAALQTSATPKTQESQVDAFLLELNQEYEQSIDKYVILVDGRLQRPVLGKNERPMFAIHLNKQYIRSLLAAMGNAEARLRCLLATAVVHEFAHCFVSFLGYKEGEITPEEINHESFARPASGRGESGRFLEGHLWGGTLEWEQPDPGHLIGDLYILDKDSNARLALRTQVCEIGSYQEFDIPLEINGFHLEPAPKAITYPGCIGFRGLRSFEKSPNPLPHELLVGRLMAIKAFF